MCFANEDEFDAETDKGGLAVDDEVASGGLASAKQVCVFVCVCVRVYVFAGEELVRVSAGLVGCARAEAVALEALAGGAFAGVGFARGEIPFVVVLVCWPPASLFASVESRELSESGPSSFGLEAASFVNEGFLPPSWPGSLACGRTSVCSASYLLRRVKLT